MTIPSNNVLVSGPYVPDGSNRSWDFDFKITDPAQIVLVLVDENEVETEITSGFTVPSTDINSDNGGTITYPVAPVDPLEFADYEKVYLTRRVILGQPNKIGNQGGFYPQVHEETFDLIAMQIQQVNEKIGRTPILPVSADIEDLENLIADILILADLDDELAALSGVSASIETVAGISDDVTTVAGIPANVTAVAGIADDVAAVSGVAANVTTVAGIADDVPIVAGISAQISTLAALDTEIEALNAIIADITTAAGVATHIATVAGVSAEVEAVAAIAASVSAVATIDTEIAAVYAIGGQIVALEAVDAEIATLGPRADDISTVADNIADIQAAVADLPSLAAKLNIDGSNVGDTATALGNLGGISFLDDQSAQGASDLAKATILKNTLQAWEQIGPVFVLGGSSGFTVTGLGDFAMLRLRYFFWLSGSGRMELRTSTNNGASYDASGYPQLINAAHWDGASATNSVASFSDSGFLLGDADIAGIPAAGEILITAFNKASLAFATGTQFMITTTVHRTRNFGAHRDNPVARNAIQVLTSAGTADGEFVLEGVRG